MLFKLFKMLDKRKSNCKFFLSAFIILPVAQAFADSKNPVIFWAVCLLHLLYLIPFIILKWGYWLHWDSE